jgi:hypothetical protein
MEAVYPEMYQQTKLDLIEKIPEMQKSGKVAYKKRLALTIFTGVPMGPEFHPGVIRVFQASYANEPGSEGGTQAPVAQPQFGSISKDLAEPTPAQERAG